MKADQEHLPRPRDASFRWFERRDRHFAFHWHYHAEYELTLITRGRGRRFVGDHTAAYGPLDLVLIGPELPHTWSTPADGARDSQKAIIVQFGKLPALAAPEFAASSRMLSRSSNGLAFSPEVSRRAARLLRTMRNQAPLPRFLSLLALLELLAGDDRAEPLSGPRFVAGRDEASNRRLDAVCSHLAEHYTGTVEQPAVAALAGMTVSAFSRFFKRMTGRTFTAYLQELRIGHACDLLLASERRITDIAFASGFESLTNFNECFARLRHMTPRQYRRSYRDG
jgi:AraC-like DNA-binding protein